MKIKKINKNESKWFDLKNNVEIKTENGIKKSNKFFFNGYSEVFNLKFSDGSQNRFTSNHKLKLLNGEWCSVKDLECGFVFNNSLILKEKENFGVEPTMDMEVEDVHYYILQNGIHSHNSSFILGQVSPSIEPIESCYYVKDLAKGKFSYKNPYLKKLLKEKGKDDDDTWKSILLHGGSVQHLDFLTQEEKDVFKTFGEISQKEIIIQAAQRQKYIDQGQSLNIMVSPDTKAKEINELMIFAWEQGIKALYYQRSGNAAQNLARNILSCKSCES
jgi:hypothetical protein